MLDLETVLVTLEEIFGPELVFEVSADDLSLVASNWLLLINNIEQNFKVVSNLVGSPDFLSCNAFRASASLGELQLGGCEQAR